jgi:hypothetical protein
LEVTLRAGTRILDAKEPDPAVLSYLQKEFGREILTQPPWKSLPRNKQLTLEEPGRLLFLLRNQTVREHSHAAKHSRQKYSTNFFVTFATVLLLLCL